MGITVREARREDARQMLQAYNNFIKPLVGSASRTVKSFTRILRRKDNLNWVAVDEQNRIVGYLYTRLEKSASRCQFREIVVDPEHDLEQVAKLMVEKAHAAFAEKKLSSMVADSFRNPVYEKLFPKLGFFESESNDVFMYAIINMPKFLNEVSEVFVKRLMSLQNWNGLMQIECEGSSLHLEKSDAGVQRLVWTNRPVSLKVTLTRELLIKLLFGLVNPVESHGTGQLRVETTESPDKVNQLLRMLFPEKRFLIMDYW